MWPEGLKLIGPYDCSVRINSILIEANAGRDLPQRGVAVAENKPRLKPPRASFMMLLRMVRK